jgi:hypothetical protein
MFRKMALGCAILSSLLGGAGAWGFYQRSADATARVPALDSFHEVIFKIWHDAWPAKNVSMLRQLAPEVEKGIDSVASAQLPGILRGKRSAWEEGIRNLQSAGSEYRAAVAAKDDGKLMAAAESLHSRFEALMRITRPALKELDEFHSALYMLYHHYVPENDTKGIRLSAAELKQKMTTLSSATLPGNLKEREPEFQKARANLSKSVDDFESSVRSDDDKLIKEKVETLHSNYVALVRILE